KGRRAYEAALSVYYPKVGKLAEGLSLEEIRTAHRVVATLRDRLEGELDVEKHTCPLWRDPDHDPLAYRHSDPGFARFRFSGRKRFGFVREGRVPALPYSGGDHYSVAHRIPHCLVVVLRPE